MISQIDLYITIFFYSLTLVLGLSTYIIDYREKRKIRLLKLKYKEIQEDPLWIEAWNELTEEGF